MNRKKLLIIMSAAVLIISMLINCLHTHLWGPDEPREAEIAREICNRNSWVVPYFNGLPFVEKPPLYYDVSALIYKICPKPGALRLHSALLGCLMLAALYIFAAKKCGNTVALCACTLCASMPQFYRPAHWILLDIGVGAWVTAALVCYGLWSLQEKEKKSPFLMLLFFSFAALGMLTKGFITIVYIGIIVLPHWLFFRRRQLPPVWTILVFLIPVGLWIFLFYREGGIYYLHEHFINNIFGRLLHREFRLEGTPITVSDVGHNSPLLFYFKRLPEMLGAAIALVPFAVIWAWRTLEWKFFCWKLPEKLQKIWDFLSKPYSETFLQKDLIAYLMLWSFVPLFAFSVPAIKEVTYLLPSYAGIALLVICYLADRLRWEKDGDFPWLSSFIIPLLCFAVASQILSYISLTGCFILYGLVWLWLGYLGIRMILRRQFSWIVLPILTGLLGGVMLGNTPELMERSRVARKCYCKVAEMVWREAGNRKLCLLATEESIRGAIPFYGNRDIDLLTDYKTLCKRLALPGNQAFLLYKTSYREFCEDPEFAVPAQKYRVFFPDVPKKSDTFVLLVSDEKMP